MTGTLVGGRISVAGAALSAAKSALTLPFGMHFGGSNSDHPALRKPFTIN